MVKNTIPAPLLLGDPDNPTHTGFAAGQPAAIAQGLASGVPQKYLVQNDTQVNLTKSNTALQLSGTFKLLDQDPNGNPLPITVTFSAPGTRVHAGHDGVRGRVGARSPVRFRGSAELVVVERGACRW